MDNPAGLPTDWANTLRENNQHTASANASAPFDPSKIDNIALVNGQYRPTIHMRAGKWHRWRVLNAGALFFLDLQLRNDQYGCEVQLLAIDGVYLQQAPRKINKHIVLTPAGRADILLRCKNHGHYVLSSGHEPGASGEWNRDMYWNPVFANVKVHRNHNQELTADLSTFEVKRPYYLQDLRAVPSNATTPFSFAFQDMVLVNNDTSPEAEPLFPHNGDDSGTCTFNGKTFDRGQPLLIMEYDSVQEWHVDGVQAHPLHIHINPMQIQTLLIGASDKHLC